ncbi:MAG: 1-deoxy-D-xylulose-5-phosphate synthase [Candidatus Auribacterota bacterium]|nr:1-deoxy-D-xylulose-5-phosphate synthase [Candidatus Auribacterota bacterium]
MSRLLDKINTPADLKKLTVPELSILAGEVREEIIRVVSQTGGHLASSLGVVELTIAMYYVFDLPRDKVIWDVGHQAYAHKLLTGRRESFKTLRQYEGISGFPRIRENSYDFFGAGHASTSISAMLGMAVARDKKGGDEKIIGCIGDGSLTGGLALEALNQGIGVAKNIMVVLNANEMAISPNVGELSDYLNQLISAPSYNRLKNEIEQAMQRIPSIGLRMVDASHRLEDALKHLITPGGFFEDFGYRYFGPVNGHDMEQLVRIFSNIKYIKDPILLHVLTKKGKGYRPAEDNPEAFHGPGAFDIVTGKALKPKKSLSYSALFGEALIALAQKNKKIVAITAAMASGTGLTSFAKEFPDRFFDVGIAEGHALTFAAGMAARGLRPVVAIYSTFLQRGIDQIIHDICLQNLPVVIAVDRAGLVGEDGPTHHGVFDTALFRTIPGIIIMQPRDGRELPGLLATALSHPGPAVVRYPRGETGLKGVDKSIVTFPIGEGETIREGDDGVIWALGNMVEVAGKAAELLESRGIKFGVVNARFIKPLDRNRLLEAARAGKKIVTLSEDSLSGGFGTAVWESLDEEGRGDALLLRIGIPDRFIPHGSVQLLREECGLTPEVVADKIEEKFKDSRTYSD